MMYNNNNYNYNYNYNYPQVGIFDEANNIGMNNNQQKIIDEFFNELNNFKERLISSKRKNVIRNGNDTFQIYSQLTLDFLEKSLNHNENIDKITEKIYESIYAYMVSENVEEKKALEKSFQIACFCVYLSETSLINSHDRSSITSFLMNNNIKDLYTNVNNLFRNMNSETKNLIKTVFEILSIKIPENENNSERTKKEILENLKIMEIGSDETDGLDILRTLHTQNVELLEKLGRNNINQDILHKIEKNMNGYGLKITTNPYLKPRIISSMKLLYSILYTCNKKNNQNQTTQFLKKISTTNTEDLILNMNEIINTYDNEGIIKAISEEIIKNVDKNEISINNSSYAILPLNLMQPRQENINHEQKIKEENLKKEILENLKKMKKESAENENREIVSSIEKIIDDPNSVIDYFSKFKIKEKINKLKNSFYFKTTPSVSLKLLYALVYSYVKNNNYSLYQSNNNKNLLENISYNAVEIDDLIHKFDQIIKPYDKKNFMESIKNEITKDIERNQHNFNIFNNPHNLNNSLQMFQGGNLNNIEIYGNNPYNINYDINIENDENENENEDEYEYVYVDENEDVNNGNNMQINNQLYNINYDINIENDENEDEDEY